MQPIPSSTKSKKNNMQIHKKKKLVRKVSFHKNTVSDVHHVDPRTDAENRALFYQPQDEERSRAEVQLEKLEAALVVVDGSETDELNKLMDMFRGQAIRHLPSDNNKVSCPFPSSPTSPNNANRQPRIRRSTSSNSYLQGCARIA